MPAVEGEGDDEDEDVDEDKDDGGGGSGGGDGGDEDDEDIFGDGSSKPTRKSKPSKSKSSSRKKSLGDRDIRARGTAASVRESYVVDLTAALGISSVRDVAFLHGYGEPVLLILHEKRPTWWGCTSYNKRPAACKRLASTCENLHVISFVQYMLPNFQLVPLHHGLRGWRCEATAALWRR